MPLRRLSLPRKLQIGLGLQMLVAAALVVIGLAVLRGMIQNADEVNKNLLPSAVAATALQGSLIALRREELILLTNRISGDEMAIHPRIQPFIRDVLSHLDTFGSLRLAESQIDLAANLRWSVEFYLAQGQEVYQALAEENEATASKIFEQSGRTIGHIFETMNILAEANIEQAKNAAHDTSRLGNLGVRFLILFLTILVIINFLISVFFGIFRVAEEVTRDLAMRDPLTGIRNRRGLTEALESAEFNDAFAAGAPIMLALADLDGFKPVNDTYGHAAGDELLKQIAHRLDCEVARQGIVARLGGDEFALMLLLDPADPEGAAEDAARRLMGVVRVPLTLHPDGVGQGGRAVQVRVGLSLGVALAPVDATDAEELMRRADSALYRAKAEGRGRFRRFTPEMDPRLGKRRGAIRLEAELREALAQDSLTCHYQPIRQLATGQLVGFEALARWPHATRGFVSPTEFIPIAEAAGLIVPLTHHLLRSACRDAAAWPQPLTLSFNLSPLHLSESDLPRQVAMILEEAGLPATRLQLELTEGALLGDLRQGRAMLSELKAMGVRLALDDFGTGHSGLRELQALPFDVIKVDAAFVRAMASDAGARKIVAAIIGLGESLGLPVVAEGIEEQIDSDFLAGLGCEMGQGWLLGRPVPARELGALMTAPAPGPLARDPDHSLPEPTPSSIPAA